MFVSKKYCDCEFSVTCVFLWLWCRASAGDGARIRQGQCWCVSMCFIVGVCVLLIILYAIFLWLLIPVVKTVLAKKRERSEIGNGEADEND